MKRESAGQVQTQCYSIPDEVALEHGERLGGVVVAYETYGRQNPENSNAILVFGNVTYYYTDPEASQSILVPADSVIVTFKKWG